MLYLKAKREDYLLRPCLTSTDILGLGVVSPLFNKLPHIIREFAIKPYFFAGTRMNKANGLGVQGMTGTDGEAIFYKLLILTLHRGKRRRSCGSVDACQYGRERYRFLLQNHPRPMLHIAGE